MAFSKGSHEPGHAAPPLFPPPVRAHVPRLAWEHEWGLSQADTFEEKANLPGRTASSAGNLDSAEEGPLPRGRIAAEGDTQRSRAPPRSEAFSPPRPFRNLATHGNVASEGPEQGPLQGRRVPRPRRQPPR